MRNVTVSAGERSMTGRRSTGSLRRCASTEAEPLSDARMVCRGFCEKVVLAGFAAEAKAPMMMGNKTELSAAVCAAILRLAHERAS